MSKRRYVVIGTISVLLIVLCICFTMCGRGQVDNTTDKKNEGQTEKNLDTIGNKDEVKHADDSDNKDKTVDAMKEVDDKTADQQNQTLNESKQPSQGNSVDYEDVWGEEEDTSGDSGNSSSNDNDGSSDDSNQSKNDEELLDDVAEDDKKSGYSRLF